MTNSEFKFLVHISLQTVKSGRILRKERDHHPGQLNTRVSSRMARTPMMKRRMTRDELGDIDSDNEDNDGVIRVHGQ